MQIVLLHYVDSCVERFLKESKELSYLSLIHALERALNSQFKHVQDQDVQWKVLRETYLRHYLPYLESDKLYFVIILLHYKLDLIPCM